MSYYVRRERQAADWNLPSQPRIASQPVNQGSTP